MLDLEKLKLEVNKRLEELGGNCNNTTCDNCYFTFNSCENNILSKMSDDINEIEAINKRLELYKNLIFDKTIKLEYVIVNKED